MAISSPVYGSILLGEELSITALIERLDKVSDTLLQKAHFGAYMVDSSGNRYYGLEKEEVISLYFELTDGVKNLALSLSGPEGGGVRINLHSVKDQPAMHGQYVITTQQNWRNKEIQEILQGIWVPKLKPHKELMSLLLSLKYTKEQEQAAQQKQLEDTIFQGELFYQESSFYIDAEISFQRVWGLLEEISVVFLNDTSFHFRLGTTDGDYFVDLPPSQLKQIFRLERKRIHTLYIDSSTEDGQRVDISLRFHKTPANPNGMIEVTAYEAQDIVSYVIETLSRKREQSLKHSSIFQQKFSFDPKTLSIETLLHLTNAIAGTYFKGINATADLFTFSGKSFTQLSVKQLKEAYYRNEREVKKIGIYVSEGQGMNFFFAKFNWDQPDFPRGEIQMLLGDEERHVTVRDLIWQKLGLSEEKQIIPINIPKEKTNHARNSIFRNKQFRRFDKGCLIIMPLETYWTEPIWATLKSTLDDIGFDHVDRVVSLSQNDSLDQNWQKINEASWILADLTYRQPFVFYWLGIAHALGKKVLLLSQHKRDIPNSLGKLPYLLYENNLEGLEKLQINLIGSFKHPYPQ
ncbi:MAG: hypothetical protein AAGA10_18860 [Bacteroidota bacterium]